MTHIERLSIQGIRSFSPDEPQEIRFLPLTIIIGPNGSGKTSIIESLKYATTGIMPPNSNGGKTFIHDIQFVDNSVIRGQIRLAFTDIENKSAIITRSMQVSMKNKNQITFRQMNATIKRDKKSIDQKLANINSELLELIGVSKAILNNVIFCHQEEIHWPLSDGKILKEKFDDIFGSIAFSKALEKIKKIRDEEMSELKSLRNDVKLTQHYKKEADKKRKLLSEEKMKVSIEKDKISKFQTKIDQINTQIKDLMEKEQNAEMVSNKILQLESSIKEKQKHAENIETNCSNKLFTLTKNEIDERIANFNKNFQLSKLKKTNLESQIQEINLQYENLFQQKQQYSYYVVKLNDCEKQIKKFQIELKKLIQENEICLTNDIENIAPNNFNSVNFCYPIQSTLLERIENNEKEINIKKEEFFKEEFQINDQLDSLKNDNNKMVHEIEILKADIENIQQNLNKIAYLLKEICPDDNLKNLEEEIFILKCKLTKYPEQNDEYYKIKIEYLEEQKKSLQNECKLLNTKILFVNEMEQKRIELDHFKNQKTEKLSKMEAIKMNNLEIFNKLNIGDGDFSQKLSILIQEKNVELDKINSLVANIEKNHTTQFSKVEIKNELLLKKMDELKTIENKFDGICSMDQFDNFFKIIEHKLIQLRNDKSNLENISPIIDKFILKIDQEKSCPICENDLNSQWISKSGQKLHTDNLIEKLKRSKDDKSKELDEINRKLSENENQYNKLVSLKSEISTFNEIKKEICQIENEIKMFKEIINNLQIQLTNDNTKKNSITSEINYLRECMKEAIDYDNTYKDLITILQKLKQIDCNISSDSIVDLDDLKKKVQEKELELNSCDSELSLIQKEYMQMTDEKMKLQALERNKIEHEKKKQSQMENIEKQKELTLELESKQFKLSTLYKKNSDFNPKIQALQNELQSLKKNFNSSMELLQQKNYHNQDLIRTFDKIMKEIDYYSQEWKSSRSSISKPYDELENNLKILEEERKNFMDQLNSINQTIANCEINKRELFDYQTLLILKNEILKQEDILKEEKKKIGFMKIIEIRNMRIEAEREQQNMITQKTLSNSRIFELEQKINELNLELHQEEYRNANEKYQQKSVDKVITELSCEDLDKYYKALDFAITTFHRNKMEAINKLIEQFWKVSYQGNDIESIQIMADEEERNASDRRRSYNYRVVMVKQSKVLDMKGRCSAGQKVLASLIIRIALAIIFSNKFTVITLDEPTTNLDNANIRAFAEAIINLRKINKNLQIIIITHDEDFLHYLTKDDSVQYYYKVFKNDQGYSTIVGTSTDSLEEKY